MKKMNKKGFTLIEMLVVIAIIAILVSIIIPTVTSATDKAAAATNAANLRSVKAEATTNYLLTGSATATSNPLSKKVDSLNVDAGLAPTITLNESTKVITVTYGEVTIAQFAEAAGGGSSNGGSSDNGSSNGGSSDNGSTVTCTNHTNNGSNVCATPGCGAVYTPGTPAVTCTCTKRYQGCTCSGHQHASQNGTCGKVITAATEGSWSK